MNFPKDQEFFKDINCNGKLSPSQFPAGYTTASQAFFLAAKNSVPKQVQINYKVPITDDETEKSDSGPLFGDIDRSVEQYNASIFSAGADAAYQQTKCGYIGEFPDGSFSGGHFSDEDGNFARLGFYIKKQLEHYSPLRPSLEELQELYRTAYGAKQDRRFSSWGILFLLLHMVIMAISSLPLLPGMEGYSWFGHGWDWAIIAGGCLTLVIAWACHSVACNSWGVLGFIHMLLTVIVLGWQIADYESPDTRLFFAGITLIVTLISIIHYLYDAFERSVARRIRKFTEWYDQEALDNYRRLRFTILWYKNISGEETTPFDSMQKEFITICENRKKQFK